MSEETGQVRDRATLLAEFKIIASKYSANGDGLAPMLAELVQRVPKDAFNRSFLPENVALLIGEIDEDSSQAVIQDMWDIHRDLPVSQPLQLILSSCGGQVYSGLAIIGTINELRRQGRRVHIHVSGWALSMAFEILQAADYRSMEPTAYLMTHEEQYGYEGNTSDQEQETKFSRGQETLMLERLASRTGKTVKYYRDKIAHKNWYIGPDAALAEGFIDEVKPVPPLPVTVGMSQLPKRPRGSKAAKRETLRTEESIHAPSQTLEGGSQQEEETATSVGSNA